MSTTTIYDVKIRYSVDGRGAAGVRGLTNEVKTLGRESGRASALFNRIGAAAAGVFGIREGYKALIGFNSTVQDTKQQVAGMLALTKKTDLADQVAVADRLYANLQRRAKALPGTTSEYTQMLGSITQPITDAGGGLKDLEDMTVNSVVAAKALRVQWDAAARDIDQALRGQFHSTDQFTGKILGSVGYKGEEGREKYNAMSADQRLEVLRGALLQKQLTQLANAQGESFGGMLSTLQSTVQEFFGKVGLPLFKAISAELKRWNVWLDDNTDKVDAFAQKLGDGLVKGFGVVKNVVGFLVDHADELLMIGKVWGAVKLTSMASDFVGGIAGKGAGLMSWLSANDRRRGSDSGTAGAEGGTFFSGGYNYTPGASNKIGFKGAMENADLLSKSLAVGYTIGTIINDGNKLGDSFVGAARLNGEVLDITDKTTAKFYELQRSMDALKDATDRAAAGGGARAVTNLVAGGTLESQKANAIGDYLTAIAAGENRYAMTKLMYGKSLGLKDEEFTAQSKTAYQQKAGFYQGRGDIVGLEANIAMQGAMMLMTDLQRKTLDQDKAMTDVSTYIAQHLDKGNESLTDMLHLVLGATEDPTGKKSMKMSQKPNVNVTIQRIEVQSEDPDRYAFGLVEAFRTAVKNPSQAVRTIREG